MNEIMLDRNCSKDFLRRSLRLEPKVSNKVKVISTRFSIGILVRFQIAVSFPADEACLPTEPKTYDEFLVSTHKFPIGSSNDQQQQREVSNKQQQVGQLLEPKIDFVSSTRSGERETESCCRPFFS